MNNIEDNAPELSELQQSLLIMTAIKKNILKIIHSFPLTPAGQNRDLKFILNNSLELEVCKFLEEFGYLGRHLKSGKKEWILKVLAPVR